MATINVAPGQTTTVIYTAQFTLVNSAPTPLISTTTLTGPAEFVVPQIPPLSTTNSDSTSTSTPSVPTVTPAPPSPPLESQGVSPSGPDHWSTGAIAGLAVGTAILGAALAAAVLVLIMKRKTVRSKGTHRTSSTRLPFTLRRDPEKGAENPDRAPRAINLELILPQPLDDASIREEATKLHQAIEDHVDSSFYDDKPTRGAVSTKQLGAVLPAGMSSLKGHEVDSILDAGQAPRFTVLKTMISAELCAAIGLHGDPKRSILPEMVVSFLSSTTAQQKDTHRARLTLSRWRTSTFYLLGDRLSEKDKDHRDQAIQDLILNLDVVLRPFSNPELDANRKQHLFGVCKQAAQMGMLLFSQPAEWAFNWSYLPKVHEAGGRHQPRKMVKQSMVVFPGLVRLTDNSAQKLEIPRVVFEPRVKN